MKNDVMYSEITEIMVISSETLFTNMKQNYILYHITLQFL